MALASDTYCNSETPYGKYTLDEIKTFVNEAGVGIFEALMISTSYAAKALGTFDKIGAIEEGKIADLLILDSDITKDINLLTKENINLVIKDGKIVR